MESNILEDRLKQAMALVNKETMVVDPDVLESRAGALFRDVGADELLVTLSNLKLADGNYVRENLGTFVEKLKSEDGQAELRSYIAKNEAYLKRVKQVAAVTGRLSSYLDRGVEFRSPGDGIAQILALMFTEVHHPSVCRGDLDKIDSG